MILTHLFAELDAVKQHNVVAIESNVAQMKIAVTFFDLSRYTLVQKLWIGLFSYHLLIDSLLKQPLLSL